MFNPEQKPEEQGRCGPRCADAKCTVLVPYCAVGLTPCYAGGTQKVILRFLGGIEV
jgi:hypothetical protein